MKYLIESKLRVHFSPHELVVVDESYKHEGHWGHKNLSESHFKVYIVSDLFRDRRLLDRHQMVYKALHNEMPKIHALSISALTKSEVE